MRHHKIYLLLYFWSEKQYMHVHMVRMLGK